MKAIINLPRGARLLLTLFSLVAVAQTAFAQTLAITPTPAASAPSAPSDPAAEQTDLNQAIAEANGSAIDVVRALERHLLKYPESPRRADIEASLYKTATDTNDRARIILYGERLLARQPANEMEILDRVGHALLISDDPESSRKAWVYARRYEVDIQAMRARTPEGHATAAQWADLSDRALARATVLNARAVGNLGNVEEAANQAKRSWIAFPTAESASEAGHWLEKLGHVAEAAGCYAEAATVEDARSPWSERDRYRKLATTLYIKLHGSADGLGDAFLQAWDLSAAAVHDRIARYQAIDPNYGLSDPFAFKLPAAGTAATSPPAALEMANLKGKTVVVDFWATWCLPCISQHPLIENVRRHYAQSPDVGFLSLDADDDHTLVAPFLQKQNWQQRVYLEAGLAGVLNVTALPTILVIDPSGKVFTRMTGFNPDTFEHLLSARIDEARTAAAK
jgi:thiol-disulfide isomerase/thioredoxin